MHLACACAIEILLFRILWRVIVNLFHTRFRDLVHEACRVAERPAPQQSINMLVLLSDR